MHSVVKYLLQISCYLFYLDLGPCHSVTCGRTKFHIVQRSSEFLLEIMTLVFLANIMGSEKELILGEDNLFVLEPVKNPALTLGQLNV